MRHVIGGDWIECVGRTPAPLDLERSPKGSTGPCWPGENPIFRQPIDFFVFNEDMWPRVVKDAQGRPNFHKLGLAAFAPDLPPSQRNKLSDHCPIRTTLDLPAGGGASPGTEDSFAAALDALDRAREAICSAAQAQLPSMPGKSCRPFGSGRPGIFVFQAEVCSVGAMLWSLNRRWQARRRLRITEADELMAAHGDRAYEVARGLMRLARTKGDRSAETHLRRRRSKSHGGPIGRSTSTPRTAISIPEVCRR